MIRKQIPVLVIEENAERAVALQQTLSQSEQVSCCVVRAESVAAAMSRITETRFDAVVFSPESCGISAANSVRNLRACSPHALPVIVVCDRENLEFAQDVMRAGADACLVESEIATSPGALIRSIVCALERRCIAAFSQHHQHLNSLCEMAEMLQLVLDHMPAFVFWKDRNSVYLGCNSLFAANAGLASPEDIVGLTDLDLPWRDSEAEKYLADDKQVMSTGIPKLNYEETQLTANGHLHVRTSKIPLRDSDGQVVGILGTFEDITQRKEAEAKLAEAEAKYRSLVEESLVGVYLIQQDHFVYANDCMARIFGYNRPELVGLRVFDLVAPEDRERVLDNVRKREADEIRSIQYSFHGIRKDGQVIEVEVLGARTTYNGSPAVVGSLVDVTERNRAQEEQANLRQHLQQAQKMEAVGHLAGGIAHDFNNILGIIIGYSDVVLRDPNTPEETRSRIEEIASAGQRAASLTRRLLAFSRKLVLQPQVLNLNEVIEGVEKMLRRLLGDEIQIRTKLDPNLGLVQADPSQIEQVLLNLCINARDAMPEGGTLTIETAKLDSAEADARFEMPPGPCVKVSVKDTGVGMNDETLSHLFEPFFTTKEPDRGTGLGLATVYGIVKQSGGHVWAQSKLGKGSTFTVCLPETAREPQIRKSDEAPETSLRGSETVLLVEDAAPLRSLLAHVVEEFGYKVLQAEDGRHAIQVAKRFTGDIAILVTDVSMPRMRGSALAKALARYRPNMRVLFMSGHSDTVIAPDGVLDPGTGFLQKPFTPQELVRKMRELLDTQTVSDHRSQLLA
jgi:two-component system cell cycle sensor histidine kinase/response regulator CckA